MTEKLLKKLKIEITPQRIIDILEEKIHDELTGLTCEQFKIKSNEKTEETFTE